MVGTVPRKARAATGVPAGLPAMAKGNALHQSSLWLFGMFALAMVVAFWPSYFSRLGQQPSYHFHAHGLAMTAWVALLVSQAWLMRTGQRATHKRIGKLSYILAPLVVVATVHFAHFRVQVVPVLDAVGLYFLTLVLNALVAFGILYGLAMYYRRQPQLHARYMIGTLFPLFTPVTDRLIGRYIPSLVPMVPAIDGAPIIPVAGFLLADVMLVGLSLWDWGVNRRANVFPVVLGVVVLYHVSVMTFYRLPFWITFGNWFIGLPLS
jgi:hypothetical protein